MNLLILLFAITSIHFHQSNQVIQKFDSKESLSNCYIVNDGVMGGLSSSKIVFSENGPAVFQGIVSLENYGGFASVRMRMPNMNLENYKGIVLKVKGDGKKYNFRIRTDEGFDGAAYSQAFMTTKDEWEELFLPFDNFLPQFRGRILTNYPDLNRNKIRQLGILISDKQEGSFELDIEWIAVK